MEKKKGPQMVNLLDSKRSNNVSIMLAQFRISFDDIKIAILELNEDILDAETVEKMIPACPEASEMVEIQGYDGELKLLGKAELYFREVGQINRLQTRLQTFHYKLVYEDKINELKDGIGKLNAAVEAVTKSAVFKKLLEVVLTFGNFLNQVRREFHHLQYIIHHLQDKLHHALCKLHHLKCKSLAENNLYCRAHSEEMRKV